VSLRPDLVECWVFRVVPPASPDDPRSDAERLEILLIRRAPHRIFPGLWQCVTGGVEPGERIPVAAMREVHEETGLGAAEIEAFYDLDQVAPFYDEGADAVVVSAIFAARVRPEAVARESWEHDGLRWVPAGDAPRLAIWPSYGESVRRVRDLLLDPALEPWFRLDDDGRRIARGPAV
jgi:8-oxo-dGTP pyrophosphatase MutT (NUDIX family)